MNTAEIVVAVLGTIGGAGGIVQIILAVNKIRQGSIKAQKDRQYDMKSQRDEALERANELQDEVDNLHKKLNRERTARARLQAQVIRLGAEPIDKLDTGPVSF